MGNIRKVYPEPRRLSDTRKCKEDIINGQTIDSSFFSPSLAVWWVTIATEKVLLDQSTFWQYLPAWGSTNGNGGILKRKADSEPHKTSAVVGEPWTPHCDFTMEISSRKGWQAQMRWFGLQLKSTWWVHVLSIYRQRNTWSACVPSRLLIYYELNMTVDKACVGQREGF